MTMRIINTQCGNVIIKQLEDGKCYVIDGHHRIRLLKREAWE